jgi:hypothetical protein
MSHPYPNLAIALPAWAISLLFTLCLAYLAFRYLRLGWAPLDCATFLFLWMFDVTLMQFVFGLLGRLDAISLGACGMVGMGLVAVFPGSRKALAEIPQEWSGLWRTVAGWWNGHPTWLKWTAGSFAAIEAIRFAFLTLALPPFIWDSLTYHLTNVGYWIQTGRIALFETPVLRIYSPANYETFASWFAVFLHHDAFIEASGLPSFLLGGMAVYAMARSLDISRPSSSIAAIAYLATPSVLLAATGTKNDPQASALFLMAAAVVTYTAFQAGKMARGERLKAVILLAGLFFYGLGTKAYILHLSLGLACLGGLIFFMRRRKMDAAAMGSNRAGWNDLQPGAGRWIAALFLAAAIFMGGYWNIRNWVLTGNPFFPYGVNVAGAAIERAQGASFQLGLENLGNNLRLFLARFGDKQARITPDLPYTTGWGWLAYSLGIPAFVWAMVHKKRYRLLAGAFLVSGIALWLSAPNSPWNMRYFIWFPAIFGLGIGMVFDWLISISQRLLLAVCGIFFMGLALNIVMTLNYNLITIPQFEAMLRLPLWQRSAASLDVHVPDEYRNALAEVPVSALLGYDVTDNGFVYPLLRADFTQRIVYIPMTPQDSCQEIANRMRQAGTRYLMVAKVQSADSHISRLHDCANSGQVLRELGDNLYVLQEPK